MSFWQSIFDERLSTSAVPIALLVWFVQKWLSIRNMRLDQTRLAVMYLNEIKKEVEIGTGRLRRLYCNGGKPDLKESGTFHPKMPTACWIGIRDILPDDINTRIFLVAECDGRGDLVKDLRWHLKNYYTVICDYGNKLLLEDKKTKFEKQVVRAHLDGATMLDKLLGETCLMMEKNMKRRVWPR